MTFTSYQAWFCVAQVTLLVILAGISTGTWLRRRPDASARVASAASGMILAVTLLAFAPFPRWGIWQSTDRESSVTAIATETIASPNGPPARDPSTTVPRFRMIELYNAFAGSVRATARYPASYGITGWIAAFVMVCTAIGFARLIWALMYLKRIYRQSVPIAGDHVADIANRLASRLGVTQRYELRQCDCLLSPAVIGWRRPTILLPSAWSTWSDDQLQAALAHELAHVSRGDSLTRLMAACATTLHFYHPLVHWLAARLSLSQELAADRLAAAAIGGEKRYLYAISQLAIWLDEQSQFRAEPLVLPAFSSNLIRTIKMLRAMDCKYGKEQPRLRTAAVVALLALAALITTALRGNAEDSTPIDEKPNAVLTSTASGKFFSRPALDFTTIGDNQLGAYVIRVGEIVQHPALRALIESQVLPDIKQLWKQEFGPNVRAPELRLDAIDYIAGLGNLVMRPVQPSEVSPGITNMTMMGSPETIVHFKQPVAWKEWIHDHIPGAVEKSGGGVSYVELPVIKAVAPKPLCIVARDDQTVIILTGTDRLAIAANPAPRPNKSELAARWTELDGGLVTFIASDRDIKLGEPTTPDKMLAKKNFDAIRLLGFAVDTDAETHQAVFRIQLTCDNSAAAKELLGTIETVIAMAKTAAEISHTSASGTTSPANGKENKTAHELDTNRLQAELVSNVHIQMWQRPNGAAGILVESTATLPDFAATETIAREKQPAKTLSPK